MTLRTEKGLVAVALALLLHPTFQGLAEWMDGQTIPTPNWFVTPLDAMPVVPLAVWLYVSWYPATATVLLADRQTFRRAYLAYLLAFILCTTGYILFPITIERPALTDTAGLSAFLLRRVYAADRPVNLFPSYHAAVAAIIWRLRPAAPLMSGAVSLWAVALSVACVLTRQHYLLDVVCGVGVGVLATAAVERAMATKAQVYRLTRPVKEMGVTIEEAGPA